MKAAKPEGVSDAARHTDAALIDLDRKIDWLHHLSPTRNHERWAAFKDSGYRKAPPLTYRAIEIDLETTREEVLSLPVTEIVRPRVAALLRAKQRELDLQLELLRLRDTEGFVAASIELFGGVGHDILKDAEAILSEVEAEEPLPCDARAEDFAAAATEEIERYSEEVADIWATVRVVDDLNSMMMVNHGHLLIDSEATIPKARVGPLIAHEVGIHVVTRYNGYQQPIRLLEVGTAHYDALQEGLGTLAEFVAGYLPPSRLRIIAARVVACDLAIRHEPVERIFAALHEEHGVDAHDAFDTAVRAKRGGGLTKDACYLSGLRQLLKALEDGASFDTLLCGKFDLEHLPVIEELLAEGVLRHPALIPGFLSTDAALERLGLARTIGVRNLYQREPVL